MVCLHKKRLGRRFQQTCICTCLFIHLFCGLARSGLPGQLINFLLNNIKPSQNAIIYYQKMCSRKVLAHFFQNYWIPVTTYFIRNQKKKNKVYGVFGKNLGQIRSNVVKKRDMGRYQQNKLFVQTPERKFNANISRNATFEGHQSQIFCPI